MSSKKEVQKERFKKMMEQAESGEIMDLDGLGGSEGRTLVGVGVGVGVGEEEKRERWRKRQEEKRKRDAEQKEKEFEEKMKEWDARDRVQEEKNRKEFEERKKRVSTEIRYEGVVYKNFEEFEKRGSGEEFEKEVEEVCGVGGEGKEEESKPAALSGSDVLNKEEVSSAFDQMMLEGERECAQDVAGCVYELEPEPEVPLVPVKNTQPKRTKVEYADNLRGRFIKALEWVPERCVVSSVFSKVRRQLWCVKGLVLLRDVGICRICGEKVRGNTWKIGKVFSEEAWDERNCFLMCGQCALCRGSKEFGLTDKVEKMQRIKLFVLKRRRKGVQGVKELSTYGLSVLYSLQQGGSGEIRRWLSMKSVNSLVGIKNLPHMVEDKDGQE